MISVSEIKSKSTQWILYLLTVASLCTAVEAFAEEAPMFGKVYTGFGISRDLLHVNAEMPTKWANVYVRAGQLIDGSGVSGQIGFRKAYKYTGTDQTGYYFGGYAGHIFPDHLNGERYNRIGAGGEMSYVWQNASRLNSVSVTMGVAKAETTNAGETVHSIVKVGFGATLQVPLFNK